MNDMQRTIENLVETNVLGILPDTVAKKKAFQLVKYVTGKNKSTVNDYEIASVGTYYGFDTITIKGKNGFIRVTLEPLFQVI